MNTFFMISLVALVNYIMLVLTDVFENNRRQIR